MAKISKISIQGFKSFKRLNALELNDGLNVLIGANGAGKSNFVSFFKFLNAIVNERMGLETVKMGGAGRILYNGSKVTPSFKGEVYFDWNGYIFDLEPTQSGDFVFSQELIYFSGPYYGVTKYPLGVGHKETKLHNVYSSNKTGDNARKVYVVPALKQWIVYHFHDTSENARVKDVSALNNNVSLEMDAGNLAAFLYKLKMNYETYYEQIVHTVKMIAPYFRDFHLRPVSDKESDIRLEWIGRETEQPFTAHQLSDGTLRFICLATVLLQPNPPSTIIIDEPELGLHPYALNVLGSLLRSTAAKTQIILSTQSVQLVNEFAPQDIIVSDRKDGETILTKLDEEILKEWLDEYSIGELWEKNVLGGRPE
jgi:predicted ATPase